MLTIEVPYCNLKTIYESGQVCTWRMYDMPEAGVVYVVPVPGEERHCLMWQRKNVIYCTEASDSFFDNVFEYFDLALDYRKFNMKFRRLSPSLKKVADLNRGLHVLRQPLWHVLMNCALLGGGSPKVARRWFSEVSAAYGERRDLGIYTGARLAYYTVPTPETLQNEYESLLPKLGRKVATRLVSAAQDYVDGWYDGMGTRDYIATRRFVGESFGYWTERDVERILLYYGYQCAFPYNNWTNNQIKKAFGMDADTFSTKGMLTLSGCEGIASAYFANAYIRHMEDLEQEWV